VLEGAAALIDRERPVVLVEAEDRHRTRAVASVRTFMESRGYDGFFILRGALRTIDELTDDMQSVANLNSTMLRTKMCYVGFLFVSRKKASGFARNMEDALGKQTNSDSV